MQAAAPIVSTIQPKDDTANWIEFAAPEGPTGPTGSAGPGITGPTGAQGPTGLTAPQLGITDGSDAPPGYIGEFISIVQDTTLDVPNDVSADITSLTLPAGDWDVGGSVYIHPSKNATKFAAWVNDISATQPDGFQGGLMVVSGSLSTDVNGSVTGVRRWNITQDTTIYLGTHVIISSAGTCVAGGMIAARRRR